ncbi:unnamed protein product [Arctogadus glacialis]
MQAALTAAACHGSYRNGRPTHGTQLNTSTADAEYGSCIPQKNEEEEEVEEVEEEEEEEEEEERLGWCGGSPGAVLRSASTPPLQQCVAAAQRAASSTKLPGGSAQNPEPHSFLLLDSGFCRNPDKQDETSMWPTSLPSLP